MDLENVLPRKWETRETKHGTQREIPGLSNRKLRTGGPTGGNRGHLALAVWLSGQRAGPRPEGSRVQFLVKARTGAAGSIPMGAVKQFLSLPLFFSFSLPLSPPF